jgi:hypothetical protein
LRAEPDRSWGGESRFNEALLPLLVICRVSDKREHLRDRSVDDDGQFNFDHSRLLPWKRLMGDGWEYYTTNSFQVQQGIFRLFIPGRMAGNPAAPFISIKAKILK